MTTQSIPMAGISIGSIISDRRLGVAGAAAASGALALMSAWLTPRGPITTLEALTSIAAALAVGIFAGWLSGSRWSLLVAPVTFVAVFELARLGTTGPTVDGIRLGSMYGVVGFVVGRGVHAVLVLLPMVLGALYGVQLAAWLGRGGVAGLGNVGRLAVIPLTLLLAVIALLLASPARVTPILGADGQPLHGSVAEITTVPLGGHDQTVMIRGRRVEDPVILYLAGGPGGTDLGAMRGDVTLEQDFVVATWEQRGVGKSYAALDPIETLTVDQMVADTVELTDYLRQRFEEPRIYLVANSWGSILAVRAAQAHPELYNAVVGTGQMVSPSETDRLFYEDSLAWAQQTGNTDLLATLRENGPPPYNDLLDYEPAIAHEHDWNPYPELDVGKEMPGNLFVPENSLMDRINGFRSFLDTFSVLYPQIADLDFRRDATELGVPYYMVLGAHEARGRAIPANEWFDMLAAPSKERVIFAHSGHRPQFEEPGEFAALMRRVLDDTYPTPPGASTPHPLGAVAGARG
jgi:proline iminopeptidase